MAVQRDPHGVKIPEISDSEAISLLSLTSKTARMTDLVYTAKEDGTAMVVDGAPPGPLGRLFKIPGLSVVEVPEEAAVQLCLHRAYDGVVRVTSIRSRTGTTFDVEKAHAESVELLKKQDDLRWARWVNDSVEDYIKRSKPVPPPPKPIIEIIKRRGFKPENFGIVPIGWAKVETEESKQLKQENLDLKRALERTMDRLDVLEKKG